MLIVLSSCKKETFDMPASTVTATDTSVDQVSGKKSSGTHGTIGHGDGDDEGDLEGKPHK